MLTELWKRIDEFSENFNKQTSQSWCIQKLKWKSTLDKIRSSLRDTEKDINNLEDRILEITQLEQQKEKQILKNKKKIKELHYNIKHTNICIYRVPEGEEI